MSDLRILFFGGFVSPRADYKASDAVGYGITTAGALVDGLSRLGIDVTWAALTSNFW